LVGTRITFRGDLQVNIVPNSMDRQGRISERRDRAATWYYRCSVDRIRADPGGNVLAMPLLRDGFEVATPGGGPKAS
jgi:hypothetical protein